MTRDEYHQRQKQLAMERYQDIAELTKQGLSARVIAQKLGVHYRTVQRARQMTGCLQTAKTGTKFTEEERRKARAMFDDGCSITEICATLQRNFYTIKRHFPNERGWTPLQVGQHAAVVRRMNRKLK